MNPGGDVQMEAKEDNDQPSKKQKPNPDESGVMDKKDSEQEHRPEDGGSDLEGEGDEQEEGNGDAKPENSYEENHYRKVHCFSESPNLLM